jgi:hypothetical protein
MGREKDQINAPVVMVWKTSERSNAVTKIKKFNGYHIDYVLSTHSKLPGVPEDAIILELGIGRKFYELWKNKYKIN